VSHWLDKVVTLLQAGTTDLRELARMAGGNEKTFYLGIDIEKLDLSQQDLRGIEFTDWVVTQLKRIKENFSPRRTYRDLT
jgi:hypothetical protein